MMKKSTIFFSFGIFCTWYISKIIDIEFNQTEMEIESSHKLVNQNRIELWNLCQNPALQIMFIFIVNMAADIYQSV